jgi:AraC-like DNA-binding protein
MSVDVLSDVLRAVRLTGAVYFDFRFRSPWVAEAPAAQVIAAMVMPTAQRVIEYHLIKDGSCWGHAVGDDPIRLHEGDLIVFPRGDPHVLSSAPGMRATPDLAIYARGSTSLPLLYQVGGAGHDTARLVCGFLGFDDRPFNPLLDALPRVIHISSASDPAGAGWLAAMITLAAREAHLPRPGGENILARMSELLFVQAIRQQLDTLPGAQGGWLAGLRDPVVGQALAALHGAASEAWTVEQLARRVGVSRSVLAERFTGVIGHPPMQYLNLWRMQLASRLLADGEPVAAVASVVGSESEAAFSRAFKKAVGQAPGTWRRLTRQRGSSAPADAEPLMSA